MKEAILYEQLANNRVRCNLCAHHCLIADGNKGICQVRENREGKLYTLVYGRTIIGLWTNSKMIRECQSRMLYQGLA